MELAVKLANKESKQHRNYTKSNQKDKRSITNSTVIRIHTGYNVKDCGGVFDGLVVITQDQLTLRIIE